MSGKWSSYSDPCQTGQHQAVGGWGGVCVEIGGGKRAVLQEET